jgi:hypothetical protein
VKATSTHGLVAYPLDPLDMEWHRRELTVTVPPDYSDPFYIGAFASPGTPPSDLSAVYNSGSFGSGFFTEALQIQVIPEPATIRLFAAAVFAVAFLIRGHWGKDSASSRVLALAGIGVEPPRMVSHNLRP